MVQQVKVLSAKTKDLNFILGETDWLSLELHKHTVVLVDMYIYLQIHKNE